MRNRVRTNSVLVVAAAFLLLTHSGTAGAVPAAGDEYDPRHDPNYTRGTSERTPVNWQAVWALAQEFEARAPASIGRSQAPSQFAVPQAWHYVQEFPSPGATPPISGAVGYGAPYGGPFYRYDPWFPGWWGASPRIPWWSLVPPRTHHGDRHDRWQDRQRKW